MADTANGIRPALEYAVGLAPANKFYVSDEERDSTYFDKLVYRVPQPEAPPLAKTLTLTTLRSLADYVKHNVDELDMAQHLLHVVSPTCVQLVSKLENHHRRREVVVQAQYASPVAGLLEMSREGDRWVRVEDTVINLMALFTAQGDRDALLEILRSISTEQVDLREDTGLGQKVTVQQGVHVKGTATVPNPAILAPYRTFPEVAEQPESMFVVRLRDGGRGPEVMLKPADGGAWAIAAVEAVAEVLKGYLTPAEGETVAAPEVIF